MRHKRPPQGATSRYSPQTVRQFSSLIPWFCGVYAVAEIPSPRGGCQCTPGDVRERWVIEKPTFPAIFWMALDAAGCSKKNKWCRGRHRTGIISPGNQTSLQSLASQDTMKNTIKIRSFLVRHLFAANRRIFAANWFRPGATTFKAERCPEELSAGSPKQLISQ